MSTSLLCHAFGITGVDYTKTEFQQGKVIFYGVIKERLLRCHHCRSCKVIKKGHKYLTIVVDLETEEIVYARLKGRRFLLLSNYASLKEEQQFRLKELLRVNEPLYKAYLFKEQLNLLRDLPSQEEGARFFKAWADDCWKSGIMLAMKLANSIMSHLMGILNYFEHPINTAKVEGINNKIKTWKRQAYGFRDMDYFKLRLYHLHHQNYALCG